MLALAWHLFVKEPLVTQLGCQASSPSVSSRFSRLCPSSYHRNAGVIDTQFCTWVHMTSEDPNSGPDTCVATHMESPPSSSKPFCAMTWVLVCRRRIVWPFWVFMLRSEWLGPLFSLVILLEAYMWLRVWDVDFLAICYCFCWFETWRDSKIRCVYKEFLI